jgi:hypothetical protein
MKKRAPHLGSWIHRALETYHKEGDWKIGHREYVAEYEKLFDEEKEALSRGRKKKGGWTPLPEQAASIIKSYIWYYRHDGWKVVAAEKEFEIEIGRFTDGNRAIIVMANGIIDFIVEDEEEETYWVVDTKSTGTIPDPGAFHAMDPQLMIYPVGAKLDPSIGIEVSGIIYDYIKSKPPTIPQLTAKTKQFSRRKINTDYPTALRFLKANGFDPADFSDFLQPLRRKSPFLKRYRLPREPQVTKTIIKDFVRTAQEIYKSRKRKHHVRNITKDCSTMCEYLDICRGELNGMNMEHLKKTMFTIREKKDSGDPTEG